MIDLRGAAAVTVTGEVRSTPMQELPPTPITVSYGIIDHEGQELRLTARHPLTMEMAGLRGGVLSADPWAALAVRGRDLTSIDGVTVRGEVELRLRNDGARYLVSFDRGLTLDDATLNLSAEGELSATVDLPAGESIAGSGEIVFGGAEKQVRLRTGTGSIIGAGVTLRTGAGDGAVASSGGRTD